MTIYQEEMQRKAHHYGCTTAYDEENQMLFIGYKGVELVAATDNGFLHYKRQDLTDPEIRNVFANLLDDAKTVREYVGLYESSPPMRAVDVSEYRQIAEYGDIVFGAMYSQRYGFMFSSWSQSKDKTSVSNGDYSPSYLYSKEAFAIRAKMVDKEKLFTKEEAEDMFRCAAFARDNCESLTYDQDRNLMHLMEKLQSAYPHLQDDPPSFDEGETPQLNM